MGASVDAGQLEAEVRQHADFHGEREALELGRRDLRGSWRHLGCLRRLCGAVGGVEVMG